LVGFAATSPALRVRIASPLSSPLERGAEGEVARRFFLGVDGDGFLATIDAERAELERREPE
jgi:hypothetical protein